MDNKINLMENYNFLVSLYTQWDSFPGGKCFFMLKTIKFKLCEVNKWMRIKNIVIDEINDFGWLNFNCCDV